MNDQTRDEAPGGVPDPDVPLKRDRARLRSREPVPPRSERKQRPKEPEANERPEELREPELTPAEQLFAGQWTASLPTPVMPASTIPPDPSTLPQAGPPHYDVDFAETDAATDGPSEAPAKRRFGIGLLKKDKKAAADEGETEPGDSAAGDSAAGDSARGDDERRVTEPAAEPARSVPRAESTAPYVPPGGFTSPGHPRLGSLAPMPAATHSVLAGLDIAALVTAVILPPIGLVVAIIAIIRGKQLRGWASDLARAAVSVSLVMTLVLAGAGAYIWIQETERAEQLAATKAEQRAHDLVATSSEPFCEALAANPTIYSTADPDYGWPAVDAPGGYNAAIAEYAAVWKEIAEVAPAGIAEETAAISERVTGIVRIANALGSSNRAGDLLGLHEETDLATVESWYVEYCDAPELDAPELPAE